MGALRRNQNQGGLMMSKGYVSDFEKYMDQYLKNHPEVVE